SAAPAPAPPAPQRHSPPRSAPPAEGPAGSRPSHRWSAACSGSSSLLNDHASALPRTLHRECNPFGQRIDAPRLSPPPHGSLHPLPSPVKLPVDSFTGLGRGRVPLQQEPAPT